MPRPCVADQYHVGRAELYHSAGATCTAWWTLDEDAVRQQFDAAIGVPFGAGRSATLFKTVAGPGGKGR